MHKYLYAWLFEAMPNRNSPVYEQVGYENHKPYLRTPYQNPYKKCFGEVGIQIKDSKME